MELKLFNTLSRKREVFVPLKDKEVRMYCCGPTVYQYPHIGNLRTYVFEDVLRRVLEFNGFKVKHVMNITDVGHLTSDADTGEDKIEVSARKEKKNAWEIAEFYTKAFFEDTQRLNILKPTVVCKATDHIQDMIELILKLEKKGYTYIIDDGVYFDTSKLSDYGKLTGMNFEKLNASLKAGARVEYNPQKRNLTDFALWKFSPKDKKRQMEWQSPWGVGFPGWHIECATMSMKYLGESFDIHCGGIDHIPIHHTNEIAEAEAATGKTFVRYWLHGAFLVLGKGVKMAKSRGNFITLRDLVEEGFDPLSFRYLCLGAHYRSELKFTRESLEFAQNSLNTLRENIALIKESMSGPERKNEEYMNEFLSAINDDLNMPKALATLWKVVRDKSLSNMEKYELIKEFDKVFGLDLIKEEKEELPQEVKELIIRRATLRKIGNFKAADEIRERILREFGIAIEDTKDGIRWKRVRNK